jgi:hypothetical protein
VARDRAPPPPGGPSAAAGVVASSRLRRSLRIHEEQAEQLGEGPRLLGHAEQQPSLLSAATRSYATGRMRNYEQHPRARPSSNGNVEGIYQLTPQCLAASGSEAAFVVARFAGPRWAAAQTIVRVSQSPGTPPKVGITMGRAAAQRGPGAGVSSPNRTGRFVTHRFADGVSTGHKRHARSLPFGGRHFAEPHCR